MNVVIIEDEKLAAERLITLLKQCDSSIEVLACLESVEESVQFLSSHPHPGLLLLDIHLSDGQCFEIFKKINYQNPVIFTTAYDQYAMEAFRIFSIDYILKPVTQQSLAAAINKLRSLPVSFSNTDINRLSSLLNQQRYKKRFLGKVGQRLFFIPAEQVAYFRADNKIVYLTDHGGNRYVVDYTMEQLTELLNPRQFFRLNRSYIVCIDAIQQVKPYYNSRLKLSLAGNSSAEEMIVSRDRVADFKLWAEA
jgi:DNA-binding LytR/AlgR family response regulator